MRWEFLFQSSSHKQLLRHKMRQSIFSHFACWGGGGGLRLIDMPDNAQADWPTVLSDPHLIPTSPHPLYQKPSFTTLLQPAGRAWVWKADWGHPAVDRLNWALSCLAHGGEQSCSIGLKTPLAYWWMTRDVSVTSGRRHETCRCRISTTSTSLARGM